MKKFGKIAYYTLFSLIFLVAVAMVVSALPISDNFQIKVVQSGSMEPDIKMGGLIIIKPTSQYKIGDVITFSGNFKNNKGESLPITHRIVEMGVTSGEPFYVTKGDANGNSDTRHIAQREIIGKVLFSIPYLGYVVETSRRSYGLFAIIIIPAAIIIFDQSTKIRKELKKLKVKNVQSEA